ncbi:MAG TPA: hypothetical protein VGH28_28010 [Polyangiaceae bacterium]|jgi:hypothetical protein
MRLAALGVVLSVAMLASAKTADAGSRHLSLGEIAVLPSGAAELAPELKADLDAEMRALDLRAARRDAILSVSLVRMDAARDHAECVVSATLRSRDGGVLFAMLEGHARAQGGSGHVPESALRGAVHGALSRIPEALR